MEPPFVLLNGLYVQTLEDGIRIVRTNDSQPPAGGNIVLDKTFPEGLFLLGGMLG